MNMRNKNPYSFALEIAATITAALAILASLSFLLAPKPAAAGNNLLIGALATVNNTTSNSTPVAIATYQVPNGTMVIQHGALVKTNDIVAFLQISYDGVNFTNVAGPFWPSATNANGSDSFVPAWSAPTVFLRASVTTTSSVPLSVNFVN